AAQQEADVAAGRGDGSDAQDHADEGQRVALAAALWRGVAVAGLRAVVRRGRIRVTRRRVGVSGGRVRVPGDRLLRVGVLVRGLLRLGVRILVGRRLVGV